MNRNCIVEILKNADFGSWILKFKAFPVFVKSKELHPVLLNPIREPFRNPLLSWRA
jgi:hypothetical protein